MGECCAVCSSSCCCCWPCWWGGSSAAEAGRLLEVTLSGVAGEVAPPAPASEEGGEMTNARGLLVFCVGWL